MNIDNGVALASQLIAQREEIDQQLIAIFDGGPHSPYCSLCCRDLPLPCTAVWGGDKNSSNRSLTML